MYALLIVSFFRFSQYKIGALHCDLFLFISFLSLLIFFSYQESKYNMVLFVCTLYNKNHNIKIANNLHSHSHSLSLVLLPALIEIIAIVLMIYNAYHFFRAFTHLCFHFFFGVKCGKNRVWTEICKVTYKLDRAMH